jgi:hypothetical protein
MNLSNMNLIVELLSKVVSKSCADLYSGKWQITPKITKKHNRVTLGPTYTASINGIRIYLFSSDLFGCLKNSSK